MKELMRQNRWEGGGKTRGKQKGREGQERRVVGKTAMF
jgi:hypothetical protein